MYLFKINVISKLHVPSVDTKNFKTADWVWDTNINFTVKTTKASESRIDAVRTISGSNDNNIGPGLHAIHEGEELRNNTTLNFAAGLVTLGGNRIDLVDENDGR